MSRAHNIYWHKCPGHIRSTDTNVQGTNVKQSRSVLWLGRVWLCWRWAPSQVFSCDASPKFYRWTRDLQKSILFSSPVKFLRALLLKKKVIRYDTETVKCKAAQLWELLPYYIENSRTLIEFKDNCPWSPDNCPCRLCKTYLKNIGYFDIADNLSMT